jgi:hypothetical protein
LHGIHGCRNRGYKSARIIDEAVLGTVMATLFTDDFHADLTADVNKRLAWIARQPIPSTKKLEQEIANEDRQLKRLTDAPALAVLDRHASAARNDAPKEMRAAVDDVAQPAENKRAEAGAKGDTIASLAYDRKAAARKAARSRDGAI